MPPAAEIDLRTTSGGIAAITGGLGFVGTHLANLLVEQGQQVRAISNVSAPAGQSVQPKFETVYADIVNEQELTHALQAYSPAHVYHLAALSSPSEAAEQVRLAFEVNVWGTRNVCHVSSLLPSPPRILNVSTSHVYATGTDGALDETAPVAPTSTYAATKRMAEIWADLYSTKLDVVTARSFNHTGPGQSDQFVLPYLTRCVAEIEAGLTPAILKVGNLNVERDFTDVRDVVRAYQALILQGHPGNTYNVCSGRYYRASNLLEMLLDLAGVKVRIEVDQTRGRANDVPRLWGNHTKLTKHTGWTPTIPIEQTLQDMLAYWRVMTARLTRSTPI